MIEKNGHEIIEIHHNNRSITQVWRYVANVWRIVWEAIRSCFGRGFWTNKMPWLNSDGWMNG